MQETQTSGPEATILIGLVRSAARRHEVEEHLDELERLVDTAGGVVVERCQQERSAPDPATVVGSGFLIALAERCSELAVDTIVFDEDLSGSQVRNIEKALPDTIKVLDRAAVILDIFAQRARSREAQTQVELAQLNYLLPRLTRRWRHLSRQAGGIGTRGVGETQLEIDRRLISKRIAQLKRKLKVIERDRRLRRDRRQALASIALVGYTNAGKSSLFRRMTGASVLVEDQLFATLDPRARRVAIGDDVTAILIDTVGFIRKLPHDLVAPFRSTLEEAAQADIVVHMVDVSHPEWRAHLTVGEEVLTSLGTNHEQVLVVLNKIDLVPELQRPVVPDGRLGIMVSAHSGVGIEELCSELRQRILSADDVKILQVPLDKAAAVERAVNLPHQVAIRYRATMVDVAVRASSQRLADEDLSDFLVRHWQAGGEPLPQG